MNNLIKHSIFLVGVMMLIQTSVLRAEMTIIHAGKLLDVPGEKVKEKQSIIIRDDRIVDIRAGYVSAAEMSGARLIDLKDYFVMPGLMDMHVHLQGELGPNNDKELVKMSSQLMQMRSHMYAMRTLEAGFTTVRDVGSSPQEMYALRDAINNGWVTGPRIIAAGGVGITGGHSDDNVDRLRACAGSSRPSHRRE